MQPKMPTDVEYVATQVSPRLQNLLTGLLEKNQHKRLGFNGPQEVKKHPWFEKTNWGALLNRNIKAPFVPILNSECDISNFDVEFTSTEIESLTEGESLTEQPKYFGTVCCLIRLFVRERGGCLRAMLLLKQLS